MAVLKNRCTPKNQTSFLVATPGGSFLQLYFMNTEYSVVQKQHDVLLIFSFGHFLLV